MEHFLMKWKNSLLSGQAVAVATVINGLGPRPRENGAQMLVMPSGQIVDTIGGGRLEADVKDCAVQVLRDKITRLRHFDLAGEDIAKADMVCGGSGDVLVYHSGAQDASILENMLDMKELDGWLCYPVDTNEGITFVTGPSPGITDTDVQLSQKNREQILFKREGCRYLAYRMKTMGRLHIMGAGHVGLEIAKIADIAGMACTVFDDREEYLRSIHIPGVKCVLLDDMAQPPHTALGAYDMVAIVTRGHMYDMEDLAWALETGAGYIGMIGSPRKISMIFEAFLQRGFQKKMIGNVHSPIGLDIGAQTPQEIAVAVVAELIAFKYGKTIQCSTDMI